MLPAVAMVVLGLWGITRRQSVWRDEAVTWQVANRSIADIWSMLDGADAAHGLYYLLMHWWFAAVGTDAFTLRLPSVLAMAGAAALTAALARKLAGALAGLASGAALVLVPDVQRFAQEGRSYAMVVLGVAGATWLLVRVLERPSRRLWAGYAATMLTTALLNWLSLLALCAHALSVLVLELGRRPRRGGRSSAPQSVPRSVRRPPATSVLPLRVRHPVGCWSAAAAVVLAGTLPVVRLSYTQSEQVSWIPPSDWSTVLGVAVLLLVGAVCSKARTTSRGVIPLTSVAFPLLAVPQLGLLLVSFCKPLFVSRYVLCSDLGLALLIGTAVAWGAREVCSSGSAPRGSPVRRARSAPRARREGLVVSTAAAMAFLALLPAQIDLRRPDSRVDDVLAPARKVAAVARPGDGVLFVPDARRDTALVSPQLFSGLDDLALRTGAAASGTVNGTEVPAAAVEENVEENAGKTAERKRVVVVTDAVAPRRGGLPERDAVKLRVLHRKFAKVSETQVRGRAVAVYERKASTG